MIFLNSVADCDWLRKTVLGGRDDIKFESFMLYGSEDCPTKVELYFTTEPLVGDDFHTIEFLNWS